MLGFGWKRRVLREGAQTEGQVYGLTGYGSAEGGPVDFGVKVRVKLPDGSTREFEKGPLETRDVGLLFDGSVVPVRYDPANYKRVVLDVPALEERQGTANEAHQAQLDAQFERIGEAGAPAAADGGDLRSQLLQMAAGGSASVIDLRSSGQTSDPEARVRKLAALKDQGLITKEQFATLKAQILGEQST